MCEHPAGERRTGWHGWFPLSSQAMGPGSGPWIDLTYPFSHRVPRSAMFPPPVINKFASMPEKPLDISRLDTVVHVGTHVDAPCHFYADGPGIDEVPLERLMGEGVVAHLDLPEFGEITGSHLDAIVPIVRDEDILAIHTGWEAMWGTDAWNRHPHLGPDAAAWMIAKRLKLVALDTTTPDLAFDRRPPDFGFPIHCTLLRHGVLIAEQVANLGSLVGKRVEFQFCPLPIEGCDGAPARVLGRPLAG